MSDAGDEDAIQSALYKSRTIGYTSSVWQGMEKPWLAHSLDERRLLPQSLSSTQAGKWGSTRHAGLRELGLAVPNAAKRELFFCEGSTNVYENKGPVI